MATYYVDPILGDNSNPGTYSQPFKSGNAAYNVAVNGDSILFATGCYHIGGNLTDGIANAKSFIGNTGAIAKSNFYIGAYESSHGYDRPVLDGRYFSLSRADWTHVGSGVWRHVPTGASSAAFRLWIGVSVNGRLIGQRTIGTPMARESQPTPSNRDVYYTTEAQVITALANSAGRRIWYSANNLNDFAAYPWAVYVYTGSSSVSPPERYGGIVLGQWGASANALYFRSCSNSIIENIVFIGNADNYGVGVGNVINSTNDNLLIRNVDTIAYGLRAFRLASSATYRVTNCVIENCLADAMSAPEEIPDAEDEWYAQFNDCVDTGTNSRWINVTIRPHCRTHAGFFIGLYGTPTNVSENCYVDKMTVEVPEYADDARAFVVEYSNGAKVLRSRFLNTATRSQILGKNTTLEGCVFTAGKTRYANDWSEQAMGVVTVENYITSYQVENVVFRNNVFDVRNWPMSSCAFGVIQNSNDAQYNFADQVTFVNNVALLREKQSFFGAQTISGGPPNEPTWRPSRRQTYTSNIAQGSINGHKLAVANTSVSWRDAENRWFDYSLTASGVSNASDAVDSDYRPTVESPCLTGGTDLGYLRDMEGKQCKKHIGAYGYARLDKK